MFDWIGELFNDAWEWFKGVFTKLSEDIADYFSAIVSTIWKVINQAIDWVWGTVLYCFEWFWDLFFEEERGFVWWVLGKMFELGEWFLDQLPDISSMVGSYASAGEILMYWAMVLDKFFPVTETAGLVVTFIVFVALFLFAKFVLKLIPGVG
jgi:hypothetical protein